MLGEHFGSVLGAARAGAGWAWAEIYRDLAPSLLGFLRGRGVPDPEDVLAEVFLNVVKNLGGFEGDERSFRTWVFTIAHRRLVDGVRARAIRPADPVASDELPESPAPNDTEDVAMARLHASVALDLIRRMPADRQNVLLLRLLSDLSIEEIAVVVGKRSSAVKMQLRRALASLKKELERAGVT